MNTAIEKFDRAAAAYLRNATFTGKSPVTLDNYRLRISRFRELWTEANAGAPAHDPDYADVLAYRDKLLEDGIAASTVKQYLVELRAFFAAFEKPRLVPGLSYPENPVELSFAPRTKKRPYDVILTDEQVTALLSSAKPDGAWGKNWPRNYAMIALMLSTELRSEEIRSLTLDDLDFRDEIITVAHGKGDKFREVDFPLFARSAVEFYLQSGIRPASLPSSAPLFGTGEDWKIGTRQWLHGVTRRIVKQATGVDNVGPHDLRHIGARLKLNAGATMEELQSELGHSQITTTKIYTGRLQSRRGRQGAKTILAEMERIGERNMTLAELRRPASAG